jgi:acyl-CoA thioesterase-1
MRRKVPTLLLATLIPLAQACAPGAPEGRETAPASVPKAAPAPATTAPAAKVAAGPLVLFLGDSLSAGQGVDAEDAFPAVLGRELGEAKRPIRVVNAGVSGDTTAGGLARIDWLLRQKPDVVVVELGANDGLRALSLSEMEKNLRQILQKSQAAGARVLLLGMRIPPNYGPAYSQAFEAIYPRLAKELNVPLVPFLLEGVGGDPSLNQTDGIHPTVEGHLRVAAVVRPYLEKLVAG